MRILSVLALGITVIAVASIWFLGGKLYSDASYLFVDLEGEQPMFI